MTISGKPVVVFDMDGVLCDFALGFSRLASTMFRMKPFTTAEQVDWREIRKYGLSKEDIQRVWRKVDASEFWWETLPPFETVETDRSWMKLLSEFAEIHYVTNRAAPANVDVQTVRWLAKHDFPAGPVHVTREKAHYVENTFSDNELWGCIDDSPYNIEGYASLELPLFVREWQFNQGIRPEIPRVQSVKEFCLAMLEKADVSPE